MAITKYDIEVDLGQEGTSHRYMVELIGSNKSVLDVGCSSGYLAKVLHGLGNTVSGVEVDPAAAAAAREWADPVVEADLDTVDLEREFGDRRFQVIVFGDVLEHLRDPLPVLRQARGLLAPGGYIVISIPNISHGDVRMSLLLGRFPYRNLGLLDTTHLRFFTRATLRELLADAGFVATEVRTTKAPLFGTELGVRPEEVDPEVVRRLEQDPDATTYQFVLTAVPDDATQLAADTGWRLSERTAALQAAEAELTVLREEREGLTATNAVLRQELTELRTFTDDIGRQGHQLRQDVAALYERLAEADRLAQDAQQVATELRDVNRELLAAREDAERRRDEAERALAGMRGTITWRTRDKAVKLLRRK